MEITAKIITGEQKIKPDLIVEAYWIDSKGNRITMEEMYNILSGSITGYTVFNKRRLQQWQNARCQRIALKT